MNYLFIQWDMLTVVNPTIWHIGVLDTTLCDKVGQWLAKGRWFSPDNPVSSTNKTYHHDITETLLKLALGTINQPMCCSRIRFRHLDVPFYFPPLFLFSNFFCSNSRYDIYIPTLFKSTTMSLFPRQQYTIFNQFLSGKVSSI